VDGVLIPVHLLVNGATVIREEGWRTSPICTSSLITTTSFWPRGCRPKSYLDSGNRGDFANAPGVARLHVDPMARE